jgi:hypothetical protein
MALNPFSNLKAQFAQGLTPDPGEMRGYYTVRLVSGFFPAIRFFGHCKFFPADVEDPQPGSGGFNEFWGGIRIGRFKIEQVESILGDGQEVLRVNYNRPGNPFWLRPLNDELKKIHDGYYLGRGVIQIFGLAFNSFYFSVERDISF